jgi:leader peptidase (prepilin peptidase)/N-methyltransferase
VTPVVVVVAFALGCAVGSFVNVVITRVPHGESVLHPGSHCPACGAAVRPRDNVPVLSWLLLRGRCRACGWHIPVRYLLVEVVVGAGFAVAVMALA